MPTFECTMEVIDPSTVNPGMIYNFERIRCPPFSIQGRLLTPSTVNPGMIYNNESLGWTHTPTSIRI